MKTDYEVIVLGLGGIGLGALYWLARRVGGEVLGLEQFELGHGRGASQDHSRIIRLSYHKTHYVQLAKAAYEAWAELEADAGTSLIVTTGGLDLTRPGAAIPIEDYTRSMDEAGVDYEWLEAGEIMRRWPQWRVGEEVRALYQAQSGIAPAIRCNAAHLRMARAYGAGVRQKAPVTSIRDLHGELEVVAGGVAYRCRKLVLAAGAWTNDALAHLGRQLPLTVTQEQVVYYDTPHAEEFASQRFPIWIWMDVPCFYGFPVYGERGPKVSQDVGGREVTAQTRSFEPDEAYQARLDAFVQEHLPRAYGPPLLVKTCLYTMPPDRDFVLDRLPEQPDVALAVGAAQGFKFASLLGRVLSELSLDGRTEQEIAPFAVDRPLMLEENPQRNFMV